VPAEPARASTDGGVAEMKSGATNASATNASAIDAGESSLSLSVATVKAHGEGNHYVIDATGKAECKAGQAGKLDVVLVAKDGYHINDEFPYKLKLSVEPDGVVTFPASELSRADGKYTKTEARFGVNFVGARPGAGKIVSTVALSVCTKKECVTDKVALEVPVTVVK
jgi:hypothetical protein